MDNSLSIIHGEVVVVICASCTGFGVCKSFFATLFLSKRIFLRNSFPEQSTWILQSFLLLS